MMNRNSARFGASIVAVLALSASPGASATPSVALGEVSTHVERADVDLRALLRAAMREQLEAFPAPSHCSKGPVVLSAALTHMETDGGRVTCTVSATIRTARGGTMIAIVEGRAGVESQAPVTLPLVRQAVETAAHAAMARVPEALK